MSGRHNPRAAWRRRDFMTSALGAALAPLASAAPTAVEVWKDPSCGCCGEWVRHLEANGFRVSVHETGNSAARATLRVPVALGSCHTARVEGYAIEGHVPAREIRRLLAERPKAIGLAVPGMKLGSPGMDGPDYGGKRQPYDVLLIGADGQTSIYQSYR